MVDNSAFPLMKDGEEDKCGETKLNEAHDCGEDSTKHEEASTEASRMTAIASKHIETRYDDAPKKNPRKGEYNQKCFNLSHFVLSP